MSLSSLLQAADALLATDDDRTTRAYAALDVPAPPLHDQRLDPARCALEILHRAQLILDVDPTIGTRDLSLLRALLSLLFRYGINPLSSPADAPALYFLLSSLFSTLFPRGLRVQPAQTLITTTVLHKHAPDLLRASMALAWLPKARWPHGSPSLETLRPSVLRLLEFLPLSQIMSDLCAVLSSAPPPHVRRLCSSLLTKSLLRPGGDRALFAAVFGDEENSDDLQLEKYERTATILMTVPAGLSPEEYFSVIVPRLIELLSNDAPAPYRRAASFTISRMLDPEFSHRIFVSSLMSPIIHHPFIHDSNVDASQSRSPSAALSILTVLLRNTDPSPIFISQVLSPIVPALYALSYHLDSNKVSDPVLKESVRGLLATWGRVIETRDGVNTLWSVIQSERIHWEVDIAGNIGHGVPDKPTKLALLTPEDIGKEEEVVTENFLGLYPDPIHFVQYMRSLDRLDMTSDLFVRLLEAYHLADIEKETNPSRTLVYLQMIVQIQSQLCDDSSPINILRKPEHILSFVKHALQATGGTFASTCNIKDSRGLGLEDLKIIDNAEHFGDSDSDDEPVEVGNDQVENDMTSTAINLLLAILEANPDLSARNAPVLDEIFSLLEPLSNGTLETIRGLAREARMVMITRLASSSTSWSAPRRRGEEEPQETYQKALKLLQDPILPVRAHGLLLLRQLVSSRPRETMPKTDQALIPAILSIFMQSVQDDDSYIFLNAVQGLSAMVDTFGKDVLGNLLETYTRNLSASSEGTLSKPEVDAKVRIGEALGQVIRRCGDALGIYADIIIPKLISVFRSNYVPTVLRTSAISLLGQCVKTSRISVLGYLDDLAESMIDFLQVEMVTIAPKEDDKGARKVVAERVNGTETLDSNPTAIDPTLAPLRRAGLHFWTTLLGELTLATYNGDVVEKLPAALLRRAKVTLGYIAMTDQDMIARVMAREASEAIDQFNKAMLGI